MRALLVLVPWMAMATAVSAGEIPASLVLGHRDTPFRNLIRDGEELYAPEATVRQFGWIIRAIDADADLEAEGRRIRVPVRRRQGAPWIALNDAFRQLGADAVWLEDGKTLTVSGRIRRLAIESGRLQIESTLPMAVRPSRLAQPERLIFDLVGATLPATVQYKLPPGMRAGQYRPNIVRVVLEGAGVQQFLVPDVTPGRSLDLAIPASFIAPGGAGNPTDPADPAKSPGAAQGSDQNPAMNPPLVMEPLDPQAIDPASNPDGLRNSQTLETSEPANEDPKLSPPPSISVGGRMGRPAFTLENPLTGALTFPTGPLVSPPTAKYLDPLTVEINFPGLASFEPGPEWVPNDWIKGLVLSQAGGRVTATLTLVRPTGFTVNPASNRVVVRWVRPKGQDGRLAGKVIVVDAGHGGIDGGARSPDGRVLEKNLTLSVARQIARVLSAEGAAVVLTRSDDRRIPLKDRSLIANRSGALAFISIHFNSNRIANSRSGTMTFFHKRDPVGMLLAECLHRPLVKAIGLSNLGTLSDTRIYSSGFAVLRYAEVPAVLLELGFINHASDRQRVTQTAVQERIAQAVVTGLKTFIGDAKNQEAPAKLP